jgi:small conductance mechanosensitive channel
MADPQPTNPADATSPTDLPLQGFTNFVDFWSSSGLQMVIALFWLVIGILIAQRVGPWLRKKLVARNTSADLVGAIMVTWYTFCALIIMWNLLRDMGFEMAFVRRLLIAAALGIVATYLLIRPYIPKLPFRVGNLIRTGEHSGKVTDISLLNTRLKTFDGLTVVVPNASILNSSLVNYHTIPNRRIKVDVTVPYSQDLAVAKRLIEIELISDARVLPTPRPVVYVTHLDNVGVQLGGRCWVKNPKAWATRCELLEKVKYAFDREGIPFAYPRHELVFINGDPATTGSFEYAATGRDESVADISDVPDDS